MWSGAALSSLLTLSAIGIPFGKANGFDFYFKRPARDDSLRRSSL